MGCGDREASARALQRLCDVRTSAATVTRSDCDEARHHPHPRTYRALPEERFTSMASLLRPLGATVASLLVAAASLIGANPANAADKVQLDKGHVDAFNLAVNDGKLVLNLKEDVTGSHVAHAPEDVELVVANHSIANNVPEGATPDGVPGNFYFLPITQDQSLLWPGWDSLQAQEVFGSDLKADINVQAVDGPGEVYVWSQGTFGVPQSLLKDGGFKLPNTIHQDLAAHVHANWAFTEPGTYTMTVQATASKADGSAKQTSNTAKYTFTVKPAPTTVAVSGGEDAVAPGSEVTLTASAAEGETLFNTLTWEKYENGGWQQVADANSDTLTVPAVDGERYRAVTIGGKDYATNEALRVASEEVTIKAAAPKPTETPKPTEAPEPTEPTETPKPTETSKPTQSPEPTETPIPTASTPAETMPSGNGPSASAASDDADNAGSNDGSAPGAIGAEQRPDGNNAAGNDPAGDNPAANAPVANAPAGQGAQKSGQSQASGSNNGKSQLAETGAEVDQFLGIASVAALLALVGAATLTRRARH